MPTYEFICEKCNCTEDIILSISKRNKKQKCSVCKTVMIRLISGGGGIIFKGSGWTPQFGSKAYKSNQKLTQALKKMGVDDESNGTFEITDDKEIKKEPRKNRKHRKKETLRLDK